jgi:transposase
VIVQATAMLAAGGEVWVADETALRAFPPLRASWRRRGTPAVVLISGKNSRRTILGALNVGSGELVTTVRERCRTDDVLAAVEALGAIRPEVPKLLIWDNAPPHHPHRVRDAAATSGITLAVLPFRSPELMPLEDLWRGLKQTVAANRCYPSLSELTDRALAWLDGMSPSDRLRRCGFETSKFDWLPTWSASSHILTDAGWPTVDILMAAFVRCHSGFVTALVLWHSRFIRTFSKPSASVQDLFSAIGHTHSRDRFRGWCWAGHSTPGSDHFYRSQRATP